MSLHFNPPQHLHKQCCLVQVHYLSGPIRCCDEKGLPAKPGDILTVEILNLGPLPGDEWGFGGVFDRDNGGGFLTDHFPDASKAIWDFDGIYCTSRHIPGVRFAGEVYRCFPAQSPCHTLHESSQASAIA